jgi:multidrug efflux system membrane fusion protein
MKKWNAYPRSIRTVFILVALGILYWILQYFVVYTEDAYVTVDSVPVASQVEGRVVAIHVRNNDTVKAGEPLLEIDPTSLGLSKEIAASNLDDAQRQVPVLRSQIDEVDAEIKSEKAHLVFLQKTQTRYQSLFSSGVLARQDLDNINSQVLVSQALLNKSEASRVTLEKNIERQKAQIVLMQKQLALAHYNLTQTAIVAKQDGVVTSFNTYVGAYLKVGEPLFTLVTHQNWRVIANIKEYNLQDVKPGEKVWIYLSSHPLHLYRGTVHSIARGVARAQGAAGSLEYVDPTVDWIRYDYRFPVTLYFDDAPSHLYMGADARVWIFK